VAQSAAASFNPAHKLIDQHTEAPVQHRVMKRSEARKDAMDLYRRLRCRTPTRSASAIRTRSRAGSLQRAMTAMAMSCRPDLIIFDEPTTALDVTTQIEVLAAIRDIVEQFDTAAIYITHDLAVVAQMADTIKVLLKGDEVEEADTRTMLEAPRRITPNPSGPCAASPRPQKTAPQGHDAGGLGQRHRRIRLGRRCSTTSVFDIHARMTVAVVGESGLGQIHHGAGHHRPSAAAPGRGPVQGRPLPPDYRRRTKRPAAPGADDLPDGRHRAEPQAEDPRDHRTPGAVLSRPQRARRWRRGWTNCST
jgi:peptide/nickel transport system ATP-binding protein